jgi:hypothetical protein
MNLILIQSASIPVRLTTSLDFDHEVVVFDLFQVGPTASETRTTVRGSSHPEGYWIQS